MRNRNLYKLITAGKHFRLIKNTVSTALANKERKRRKHLILHSFLSFFERRNRENDALLEPGKGEKYRRRRMRRASAQQKSNSPPLPKAEGERGRGETSNALAKGSRNNIRHFRMQQNHFSQKTANIRRIPKYEQKFSALLNFRLRTHVVFAHSADKKIEEGMGNYCVCPVRSFCLQIAAKEGGRTIVASRFSKNPIYLLFFSRREQRKKQEGKKGLGKEEKKRRTGNQKVGNRSVPGEGKRGGRRDKTIGRSQEQNFSYHRSRSRGGSDMPPLLLSSYLLPLPSRSPSVVASGGTDFTKHFRVFFGLF